MSRTAGTEAGAAAAPQKSDIGGRGATAPHRMTLHTRLSSHAHASPPKVHLGHFLASGNRLWHRGASRNEDVGNTGADDFTFLESTLSGGSRATAPHANVTDELHTKDSKGDDSLQPPQNTGEHSGQHQHHHQREPWQNTLHSMPQGEDTRQPPQNTGEHSGPHQHHHRRLPWQHALHSVRQGEDSRQPHQNTGEPSGQHQHHHLRLPWQNALHSMRQQHQQHETEKQGKQEDFHTQKLDGELQSELPRQSAVDQQLPRREGTEQGAATKEGVSAQEPTTAPEPTTSYGLLRLKEHNPATQKAENLSEHPCAASTCVHRRSDYAYENVCSSDVPRLVESPTSAVRGVRSLSSASSSPTSSGKSVHERRADDSSKRESIVDNSSSGETASKVANAGEDTGDGGKRSEMRAASDGKDRGSKKESCITPGVLPDEPASSYAQCSISDTSSRTAGPAPADTEAKRRPRVPPHSPGGGDASAGLHDETLPLPHLHLPPSAGAAQPVPCSAVCPALRAFVASSPAVSAATPPAANELPSPAASVATYPSNAVPAVARLKKSVGLLRVQPGRSPPKVDNPAKDGGGALARKESTESQAVQTASAETARSAAGSPHFSTGASSSSQTSRPLPVAVCNKLPSPLLLRQLRRRAPRESQPRAAALERSPAHAGGAAGVPETRAAAQTVQVAGGTTGEAGRSPGVLRASRTLTDTGGGGGADVSSHTGTAAGGRGTALCRRGNRRVSSLGASDTAVHGGSGHVKTVRFGSMSVHVYAREARIRSCSSESLNFALALDPAASDDQWTRAYDMSERTPTHIGLEDLDHLDTQAAVDDDDEEVYPEEDEELARGYHEGVTSLLRPAGESRRAGCAATAEKESGRVAWGATTHTGNRFARDSLWNAEFGGRLSGMFTDAEGGATAAATAELEAHEHRSLKHGGGGSSSSFTLERYPSFFEDIYGRPDESMPVEDSRGKSDRYVNPPVAVHPEQPRREDAVQACRVSNQSSLSAPKVENRDVASTAVEERDSDSGEHRAVAGAPGLPPTQRAGATTASGGLRMQGAEEPQRGASFHVRPASSYNTSEPPAGVCGSSSVVKAEATGSGWWKRLLSSSSSELEGGACASKPQQRRKGRQEQPDELKMGEPFAAEAPRDVTDVGLVRQVDAPAPASGPVATGGFSDGNVPLAGETVRKEGAVSVAGNREQQRLKITQPGEMGQEEKVRGQEPEGNDSNMPRTRFLKALFQKQMGWPELWTHGKEGRRGIRSVEKGMESPQRRTLVTGGPRRVYSQEYSLSDSTSRHLPRRQSEGAERRGRGGKEIQRAELKLGAKHFGEEAVVSPSGGQVEPVRCTDTCSTLSSPVHVRERDSGKVVHEDHQQSTNSATPVYRIKQGSMDLDESPICVSCGSTSGSTDLENKNSSITTMKDMPSQRSSQDCVIAEHVLEQDLRTGVEGKSASVPLSASNVSSFPSSHSICSQQPAASKHLVSADAAAAQQHDVPPQEHQQQFLLHQHLQKQEPMPVRRQLESRSSLLSTSSAGRNHPEEEALCKAAEEAIARSATSMSAEEKENLKDILKGWCS